MNPRGCCPHARHTYTLREWREVALLWPHSVDPGLVSQIVWHRHSTTGTHATLARIWSHSCPTDLCAQIDHLEDRVRAVQCLVDMGKTLRCTDVARVHFFRQRFGRDPTRTEFDFFPDEDENDETSAWEDHVSSVDKDKDDGGTCPLCLERMEGGQAIFSVPGCCHAFHARGQDCVGEGIRAWFRARGTCPQCRHRPCLNGRPAPL